ncbi:oxidoreductase [Kineosporia babensis]|uniref:12-oxophytodienoate reductase n=1 Tax=Kineosporia babensis TaxID=499548 RepID=A0A9X1SXM2_9ACTN|nr:12-oxophytodienoate reductase [Kineosporia babensis]MCD5315984.1 12-oxophytodienoate reductase [Kineosporia babensis]
MATILNRSPHSDLHEREHDTLFRRARVAGIPLRNRWVMAPMTRERAIAGVPSPEAVDYYARRARGGIGLIITEGIPVDEPTAHHDSSVPRLSTAALPKWRGIVDEVHAAGARIAPQLWHLGGEYAGADGSTPSGIAPDGRPNGRAMTPSDIERVVSAFADAARAARAAGFDAVELHGAHGYLIHEFLWPATNRRTDDYGGVATARARLAAEIVRAVRDAVGPAFPIIFRFSQFAERDYRARIAFGPRELDAMLGQIEDAGANVLHASQRRFWEPAFAHEHPARNLAGWARSLTGLPSITVGGVGLTHRSLLEGPGSLDALAQRVAAEEFDLVAVGRPLLRTADWVHRAGAGTLEAGHDYVKTDELIYP